MKKYFYTSIFFALSFFSQAQCIEAYPYTEDFSDPGFVVPSSDPNAGVIPSCYSRTETNGFYWRPEAGPTGTFNTGPTGDHTTGSGKYLVLESDLGGSNLNTRFITPYVDLGSATTPELRFWRHMFGFQVQNMQVHVQRINETTWNSVGNFTSAQTAQTDPWNQATVGLSAYAGDTIRVRFTGNRTSTFATLIQVGLDDIEIAEVTNCMQPNSFAVQSKTQTSVTLTWQSTNTNATTEIRYVEVSQPISAATIVSTNNSPYTVNGLTAGTTYYFWVRDSCQSGSYSQWVGPIFTTTTCGTLTAPWSEGFEGLNFQTQATFNSSGSIDDCWLRNPSASAYLWMPAPMLFQGTTTGPTSAHTGTKWMHATNVQFSNNNGPLLRTPRIDLSNLTSPELTFWVYMFGPNIDRLEVDVLDAVNGGGWSNLITITGQQQSSQTEAWEEQVVSLSAYANTEIFVRFKAFNSGTAFNANIAIDDIKIDEAPPCPRPNPFSVTGTTATTATLSFTSGGTAPWQVEYGSPGFTLGTGTRVNVTTNPATLTGLSAQTVYEVYIRDTCGVAGVSTWTGPIHFTTDCLPVTAPFVEDFDGAGWVSSGTFAVQGTLATCWSGDDDSEHFFWTPAPPLFASNTTGPDFDHTTGGGDYLFIDGGFFKLPRDTAVIESPLIDLSTLTTPELTFWYHMYGVNIASLKLYVFNGTTWTQEFLVSGQQQSSKFAPWKEAVVNLSAYANQTIKLRFVGKRTSVNGNSVRIALDDIDLHEEPACPKPTQIVVDNPTTSSLDVSWNTAGGTAWIIEYGPAGFQPGSGTTVNVSTSPHTLTGLLPGTLYDIYMYNDCSPNGSSDPAGPKSGATVCAAVPAPFYESFDGPGWEIPTNFTDPGGIEPCWIRSDTVGYAWKVDDKDGFPINSGPNKDHTTGSGKFLQADQAGNTNLFTIIRSPRIDLSPLDTPRLSFWYHMYGAGISSLQVQVQPVGGSWSTVATINGQQQSSPGAAWLERIVDLSSYANQNVFIRFRATRQNFTFSGEMAIDDILIDEKPSCPSPTNISARGVSESAVEVSWTSSTGVSSSVIEYGPIGFTPGNGTTVVAPNNPFIVNGLNPNTAYEFYVRDSCGNGGISWQDGPAVGVTYPCANACLYELKLEDQNNDGWALVPGNNNYHQVDVIIDGVARTYTIRNGGLEIYDIAVCDSSSVELRFRSAGFSSTQCGIEFRDPSGTLLYDRNFGGSQLGSGSLYSTTGACTPSCSDPVGLTIQNVTTSTASAFWSSISGYTNVAIGASGFTPGTPTQLGVTTGNTSFANLTPGTTYDVYIQDSCSNGLLSNWVGPVSFTTINCSTPTANFTASSNGFDVSFDGSSSSANTATWSWNFGDGSIGGSTNTSHTYSNPGIYTVTLIAANACGDTDSISKQVVVCGLPTATINYLSSGLSVDFDGSASSGIGFTYAWGYGDGNNGNGVNPNHVYATPGTYTVVLTATDTCGSIDTDTLLLTVCSAPAPSFSSSIAGNTVTFDASATTNAVQYYWDFGDGNTGTGVNPSNTYGVSQNYTVILMAVNACGDTIADTQVVALCTDPIASWTYQIISSSGNGMLVQFDGTASVGNTYFWDFGDGNSTTGTNFPTHTYTTPGLFYRVTLIVGNQCGDSDTLSYKLSSIGIEEEGAEEWTFYPNPTSKYLILNGETDVLNPERIEIYHLSGQKIYEAEEFEEYGDGIRLSIPDYTAPGTYILKIYYSNQVGTARFIYHP